MGKLIRTFVMLGSSLGDLMPKPFKQQPLELPSTRIRTRKSGDDSDDDDSQFITSVRNSAGELPLAMPSTAVKPKSPRYRERIRKLRLRNALRRATHKEPPLDMPSTLK